MADNDPTIPSEEWETRIQALEESGAKARIMELAVFVPTTPGQYRDVAGHLWELKNDGHWYDRHGITRPIEHNWILGICAPFSLKQKPLKL